MCLFLFSELEALYRYRDSKYYQAPSTPPEQSAGRLKSSGTRAATKTPTASQTYDHIRVTSAPIHTTYKPPPKLNLPTPQQCWSTHVPETEITIAPPQPSPAPPQGPQTTWPLPKSPTPKATPVPSPKVPASPVPAAPVQSPKPGKTARIQSATVRRDTPTKPQRPVKSAGPVRPSPSPSVNSPVPAPAQFCAWPYPCGDVNYDVYNVDHIPSGTYTPVRPAAPSPAASDRHYKSKPVTPSPSVTSPSGKPPSGRKTPLRPKAPSPTKMDYRLELDQRAETPEYLEETRKHGWMMEVHGDPLKLKYVTF